MPDAVMAGSADKISSVLDSLVPLLATDAEQAATGASEILDQYPGQPQALSLLVGALTIMGAEEGARDLLKWMAQEYPNLATVHYELGTLLGRLGQHDEASEHLSRTVTLEPNHPLAWRTLGNYLAMKGDAQAARQAYLRHLRQSLRELKLLEESTAGGMEETNAENMLRKAIEVSPTDLVATRLLGELMLRLGRLREAETTLKQALDLAPGCMTTRNLYAMALTHRMEWKAANEQLNILLRQDPGNLRFETLMIANLAMLGEREEALRRFDAMDPNVSDDRMVWLNYAMAARTVGKDDSTIIAAYRKCVELDPIYGTAWWGLADLKTYRFSGDEIATMREQLKRDDIPEGLRCHLEFALGTALEGERAYEESFQHYDKANAHRRPYITYNPDAIHDDAKRIIEFFTPDFFAARKGAGCVERDPIFIVGMPRAGSTLVEQILASHSQVEGTMELPDLGEIVGDLIQQYAPEKTFPALLDELDNADLRKLGEEYLKRTRYQRKLSRPYFTDKAGNNFIYTGLIEAILPNAKIIDARRHPLACGFSCFKQAFAPGALHLAYDQTDIGRYYRDYVWTMAHFDRVLPGRVHRVIHEELVSDPEREIRRLLEFCGLPFEEQCLRSHETDRSVRTSSSQQVRQPIQKKKVEAWQHYEPWLQPMKDALGDVLTLYPQVPEFS